MSPVVTFHAEENAAYIRFSKANVQESEEVSGGVIFDYDKDGHIVGIELLDARSKLPPEFIKQAA